MNNDYQDTNRVRCGVALSIPLVLDFLGKSDKKKFEAIRHLLPTYQICGVSPEVIEPYFVPQDLKDTGKRRIYINSNGYKILYLTKKHVSRLAKSMREFYTKEGNDFVDKLMTVLYDRWILVEGTPQLNDYKTFIDQIVAVENSSSKDNHPPCGANKFSFIDLVYGTSAEDSMTQKHKFEALTGIIINKYSLPGSI